MKIALMQATGQLHQPARNLAQLQRSADAASRRGARLLVSPELFLCSYTPQAVYAHDGQAQREAVAEIARHTHLWMVVSTVERTHRACYITASLFSPDGLEVTRYRKQNLFGPHERTCFDPGDRIPEIVDVEGWQTALGLCFDIEFPEYVRALALRGAELLLVPTAVPLRPAVNGHPHPLDTTVVPLTVVPARAFESQVYIAYANQSTPHFCARSTIADPFGRRLATAGDSDELLLADISTHDLHYAREAVDYLKQARTAAVSLGAPMLADLPAPPQGHSQTHRPIHPQAHPATH